MLPGQAEGVRHRLAVQPHRSACRGGRGEGTGDARRVESAPVKSPFGDAAQPRRDFVAGRDGGGDVLVFRSGRRSDRDRRRHYDRSGMHDGVLERVVEVPAMRHYRVRERRPCRRRSACRQQAALHCLAVAFRDRYGGVGRRGARTGKNEAQRIENAQAGQRALFLRHVRPGESGRPIRQPFRRRDRHNASRRRSSISSTATGRGAWGIM